MRENTTGGEIPSFKESYDREKTGRVIEDCIFQGAGMDRLRNEAASLQSIQKTTEIPVPKLYCDFEDDRAYILLRSTFRE